MTQLAKAKWLGGIAAVGLIAATTSASALSVTIDIISVTAYSNPSGTPAPPFTLLPLGTSSPGNGPVSPSTLPVTVGGTTVSATFNTGSNPASGEYAGNGSGFDSPFGMNDGSTNFLVAGGLNNTTEGQVTLTWSVPQTGLDLIWGTVDNDPQNFVVSSGGTTLVTGSDILAAAAAAGDCPSFGCNSGQYDIVVELTNFPSNFTSLTFTDDSSPSFEFIPGDPINATPVPAALPLFAGGLGLIGFLGARKWRRAAEKMVAF